MLDLFLLVFVLGLLALGLRRPFLWVLAYLYIDIVAPQKIGWGLIQTIPVSLIAFGAAFAGWLLLDTKEGSRFTFRQGLILALLGWCALTLSWADFPESAANKWDWVWKALVFAIFLPLTLRTRLRIEAAALFLVLSAATIIINGGVKTILGGGGYGTLSLLVDDNAGLYEGSTISTVAIAIIPLTIWCARNGSLFPRSWPVYLFTAGLVFSCLLIPVGTQTRTGLLCIGLLCGLYMRFLSFKNRFLFSALAGISLLAAIPFLPESYTQRMQTIENHEGDESASTRVAVWMWTLDYVGENPLGGGFDSYLGNSFTYNTRQVTDLGGGNVSVDYVQVTDKGRAFHSSYFELLGEQGWPGLILWLWLNALGLLHMEWIYRKLRKSQVPQERSYAELAMALQMGHIIYLFGSLFVGIGYQPFIYMLIGLQIGLHALVRRSMNPDQSRRFTPRARRDKAGEADGSLPA